MNFIWNPHFFHVVAYSVLTLLVARIAYRVFMIARIRGISVQNSVLADSKQRLTDLLGLEAVRVSPIEAGLILVAHILLVSSSATLLLSHS